MASYDVLVKMKLDAEQFKSATKQVSDFAKQMGLDVSDTARLIDQSITHGFNSAGKEVKTFTSILEDGGKKIVVVHKEIAGTAGVLSASFQSVGNQAGSLSGEFSKLAGRALLVTPIWEAMRFALQSLERTFSDSIKFMIEWETEMAKIRAITGATKEQISSLSDTLLNVSTKFGINAKEVAESANQWLRMGATLGDVKDRLEATSKLSVLSGQSLSDSAKSISAIMSAFGLSAEQASVAVDKLVAIEEKSGVSLEVLQSGFEKAGVKAVQAGLSFNQLAGYITAVNEKTRQSGELIGTQLVNIFNKMGTSAIANSQAISGVAFYLDSTGKATQTVTNNLRPLNDILTDLASKWNSLTTAQQDQLAKQVSGAKATSTFIALMSNFNSALLASKEASHSAGDAQKALADRLSDTATAVTQLQTSWAKFVTTIGDTSLIKGAIQGLKEFVINLTEVTKLVQNPIQFLTSRNSLVNHKTGLPIEEEFNFSSGKLSEDKVKFQKESANVQNTLNSSLLTEVQAKQQIFAIEENSKRIHEDTLVTINKELSVYSQLDEIGKLHNKTQIQNLTIKRDAIETQYKIADALKVENDIEAQMKSEGASALQIDIQRLGYLQSINASKKEIDTQQSKVDIAGIEQYKSIQDQIITAIISEQKTLGETSVLQVQNKILLQEKLGIHLQGIDLLKQQLELYKAINDEENKTPAQRREELQKAISEHRKQLIQSRGESFQDKAADQRASTLASRAGLDSKTIDTILHPNNASGGRNSLQDDLRHGLADPLNVNINKLSTSIDRLSEHITNPHVTGLSSHNTILPPSYASSQSSSFAVPGQARFNSLSPIPSINAGERSIKLDIGGITIGLSASNNKQLSEEVKKELTDLIAAHLLKPGTKISKATQHIIENF